jgi:hypothetical protein
MPFSDREKKLAYMRQWGKDHPRGTHAQSAEGVERPTRAGSPKSRAHDAVRRALKAGEIETEP